MKKMILISMGFIPLILGVLLNYLMLRVFTDTVPPLLLIGILFLAVWGVLGRWSREKAREGNCSQPPEGVGVVGFGEKTCNLAPDSIY